MPPITVPSSAYRLASERTEGIPEHAIEISGPLIDVGVTNNNGWGVTEDAVAGILERGSGIPIRMCNDADPHACDLANDNYSQVGYVTKMWLDDGWIHANAAITKQDASNNIGDGTWTPFGDGSWSAVGLIEGVATTFDEDGMISKLLPSAIALFTPPSKPAYTGSKFEMVAAAVVAAAVVAAAEWTTAYINTLPDSAFAYVETCYGKTSDDRGLRHLPYKDANGNVDLPHLRNALARVNQIKMTCDADKKRQDTIITSTQTKLRKLLDEATKTAAAPNQSKVTMTDEINIEASGTQVPAETPPIEATPPEVTPPSVETPADYAPDATTYTQEDLDIAVKTALEAQKTEHDAEIAKTTPNDDLQAMFASVKTETIDEINRTGLVDSYVDMVTASTILSAPYMVDGKIDAAKMTAKRTDMMAMATATVEQTIADANMMVAAMPAGKTAFDEADVANLTISDDSTSAINDLREATGRT